MKTAFQVSGTQSLARSLTILSELVSSAAPTSATELASRVGLHQSSVSRILATLQSVGFVRKTDYHHFAADYGLLAFAGRAIHQFPVIQKSLPVLKGLAPKCDPMLLTLATLWEGEVLYLVRGHAFGDMDVMPLTRYPLHISSPGLRMLLEIPEGEALAFLRRSRKRHGWDRRTEAVPKTPKGVLGEARRLLDLDVLALEGWQPEGILSAAIPIREQGRTVAALAVAGRTTPALKDRIPGLLHECARQVENALSGLVDA